MWDPSKFRLSVQASLRPVLANLAYHYKLDLPVLRALAHLLSLLSTWFNVTLGAPWGSSMF